MKTNLEYSLRTMLSCSTILGLCLIQNACSGTNFLSDFYVSIDCVGAPLGARKVYVMNVANGKGSSSVYVTQYHNFPTEGPTNQLLMFHWKYASMGFEKVDYLCCAVCDQYLLIYTWERFSCDGRSRNLGKLSDAVFRKTSKNNIKESIWF